MLCIVWRLAAIAFHAIQKCADGPGAAAGSLHPWAVCPGRIVPDMLTMAAFQFGHPVPLVVLVESDNSPFHMSRN